MRLVTRESSKNEPRNELDSLVTSLVASLDSMSAQHRSLDAADAEGDALRGECGGRDADRPVTESHPMGDA